MDQFDQLILLAVATFMGGLVFGTFSMWLLMDRRLQKEHTNTMRAMDLAARMQSRTPVTYIGREEDEIEDRGRQELHEQAQVDLEETYANEVGEDDPDRDDRAPAGMEA